MNVAELIAALNPLEPDTPVSRELLAELAPVDEDAVYGGGPASFHRSIYTFRKQRFNRAAAAAKRAILKLQEAGWDARVTRKSLPGESAFVQHIDFVVVLLAQRTEDHVAFEQQDSAEKLIRDCMVGWPYDVDAGWVVKRECHQTEFDAALSADDIDVMVQS